MSWIILEVAEPPGIPEELISYTKWIGLSFVIGSLIVVGARIADARQRGMENEGVRAALLVMAAGIVIATAPALINWLLGGTP